MQKNNLRLLEHIAVLPPERITQGEKDQEERSESGRHNRLAPVLYHVYEELQRELGYVRAQGSHSDADYHGEEQIEQLLRRVIERLGLEITGVERDEILSLVQKEQHPFGLLQELVDDVSISDIIVTDYSTISVQQGRRTCSTDLKFPSPAVYEAFVERLLQRAGASYSTKQPVADGMIGASARIHAVHKCLCDTGPYLTLRLNRFSSVTTADLEEYGLAPRPVLDYLSAVVGCGQTLLIVGEVGTGKTTLARALAGTVPGDESILVIEDTPEIRLDHPHVRYMTTREENTDGAGRISPSECIRAGMRMAMNRIIFGEMRDAEAAEAFVDVCASGHPGLSTIHARSACEALTRLELFLGRAQRGVGHHVLQEQIGTAVQVVVFINICRITGLRRLIEVKEIALSAGEGRLAQREMFRYELRDGMPAWRVVGRVSAYREALEGGGNGRIPHLSLSQLPPVLELPDRVAFREAARSR